MIETLTLEHNNFLRHEFGTGNLDDSFFEGDYRMNAARKKMTERLGEDLLSLELNPPERDNLEEQMNHHRSHLNSLFEEVPSVGGINLPEIQEEEQKGDRGDRKSSFSERVPPREYTLKLREHFEREYIINRVIVQLPPEEQEDWLLECYRDYDIESIVLVGGESSDVDYPGPSVSEGNRLITEYLNEGRRRYGEGDLEPTNFAVGNICISTRRREDFDEPERMAKKVSSGCDFFTSQIIAEEETPAELLRDLDRRFREENLDAPVILWSITPINSRKDVRFLRWLGVKIPDAVEEKILGSEDPLETSLDHFERLWQHLREVEDELALDVPMGINVSPVAIRNLAPSVRLAGRLKPVTA